MTVKLPSYEWFMGNICFRGKGNKFSGSFGCDPFNGIDIENTLRYSVWIDTDEDGNNYLKAVYYNGLNSYEATDKSIMTEKRFTSSADGVLEAQQWIIEAAENFYNKK